MTQHTQRRFRFQKFLVFFFVSFHFVRFLFFFSLGAWRGGGAVRWTLLPSSPLLSTIAAGKKTNKQTNKTNKQTVAFAFAFVAFCSIFVCVWFWFPPCRSTCSFFFQFAFGSSRPSFSCLYTVNNQGSQVGRRRQGDRERERESEQ